jgi:hypothetical protein
VVVLAVAFRNRERVSTEIDTGLLAFSRGEATRSDD